MGKNRLSQGMHAGKLAKSSVSSFLKKACASALAVSLVCTLNPISAFADDKKVAVADAIFNIEESSKVQQYNSKANVPVMAMDDSTGPILNVTAPLKLFFNNSENGLDVNNPANPTAQARFYSNGDPVRLLKASAEYKNQEDNPFNNADKLGIRINPMNTATSNYGTVEVTVVDDEEVAGPENEGGKLEVPLGGTSNQKTSKGYIVCSNTKFNFELYSTVGANTPDVATDDRTVGQLVKDGLADNGFSALDFGTITYTFTCDPAISMFVEDQRNTNEPKDTWIYSLNEVKDQALEVARTFGKTDNQITDSQKYFRDMYTQFATYPTVNATDKAGTGTDESKKHDGWKNYSSYVYLQGTDYNKPYGLDIIGINQDKLTTPSNTQGDVRTTAGITFMFENVLTTSVYDSSYTGNVDNNGWAGSYLNRQMNSSDQPQYYKYKPIYDLIGIDSAATNGLKQVNKLTSYCTTAATSEGIQRTSTGASQTSNHWLFIPSFTELTGAQSMRVDFYYRPGATDPGSIFYSTVPLDGFLNGSDYSGRYMYFGSDGINETSRYQDMRDVPSGGEWSYYHRRAQIANRDLDKYLYKCSKGETESSHWWLRTHGNEYPGYAHFVCSKAGASGWGGTLTAAPISTAQSLGVAPCFCL